MEASPPRSACAETEAAWESGSQGSGSGNAVLTVPDPVRPVSGARGHPSEDSQSQRSRRAISVADATAASEGMERIGPEGRYILGRELGRGGMAVVFLASDEVLGREVALKQLMLQDDSDKGLEERFRQEARVVASISHANIVQIYDFFEQRGQLWIAMELMQGGDLADEIERRERFAPSDSLAVAAQVARGLAATHVRGIVHRDVKPMNILLGSDGTPKLTDFGLAKLMQASVHTVAGSVMGSPFYMSPEQATGGPTGVGTDMYSLGVTLYQLVTGRLPFEGNASEVMAQHVTQLPPVPACHVADLDPRIQTIILDMLEKDPERRLPTMTEFIERAEALASGSSSRSS